MNLGETRSREQFGDSTGITEQNRQTAERQNNEIQRLATDNQVRSGVAAPLHVPLIGSAPANGAHQAQSGSTTPIRADRRCREVPGRPNACHHVLVAVGSLLAEPRRRVTFDEVRRHREKVPAAATVNGISNVRVFGSVARGDAGEDSDLDLLVDAAPGCGLFALGAFVFAVRDVLPVVTVARARRVRTDGR